MQTVKFKLKDGSTSGIIKGVMMLEESDLYPTFPEYLLEKSKEDSNKESKVDAEAQAEADAEAVAAAAAGNDSHAQELDATVKGIDSLTDEQIEQLAECLENEDTLAVEPKEELCDTVFDAIEDMTTKDDVELSNLVKPRSFASLQLRAKNAMKGLFALKRERMLVLCGDSRIDTIATACDMVRELSGLDPTVAYAPTKFELFGNDKEDGILTVSATLEDENLDGVKPRAFSFNGTIQSLAAPQTGQVNNATGANNKGGRDSLTGESGAYAAGVGTKYNVVIMPCMHLIEHPKWLGMVEACLAQNESLKLILVGDATEIAQLSMFWGKLDNAIHADIVLEFTAVGALSTLAGLISHYQQNDRDGASLWSFSRDALAVLASYACRLSGDRRYIGLPELPLKSLIYEANRYAWLDAQQRIMKSLANVDLANQSQLGLKLPPEFIKELDRELSASLGLGRSENDELWGQSEADNGAQMMVSEDLGDLSDRTKLVSANEIDEPLEQSETESKLEAVPESELELKPLNELENIGQDHALADSDEQVVSVELSDHGMPVAQVPTGKVKLYVDRRHVLKALGSNDFRNNFLAESSLREHRDRQLLVATQGAVVGQINGLSVIETLGTNYEYGEPVRITATLRAGGEGDVIDIERKAELAGQIHAKAMMIINGFLTKEFGAEQPLPVSASLVFEQSYSEVDGDSASLTGLCAVISVLAGVPIRQDLAVTGAVDQFGDVQAVGGVNEKIEGFYRVCRLHGFTGTQGVIIPSSCVNQLVLRPAVIKAVADGKFHIFTVSHVTEAVKMLTTMDWGDSETENTICYRISERLNAIIAGNEEETWLEQIKGRSVELYQKLKELFNSYKEQLKGKDKDKNNEKSSNA
ncbi:hypothetical protein MXE38_06805 [Anaerobiospirillum sp. NML120448]|uniref:S16 family serine protease n=1 Tax=Anaerobiospirillum sp. NML120448 TaxID=2932816 RepID=UPI001FF42596|nr:S16 family serine protease [Anaerobiospirillum sp. NML120448]MCK0514556.1 hypothetical protein [Anaerobiospirillum sp. NML120448]